MVRIIRNCYNQTFKSIEITALERKTNCKWVRDEIIYGCEPEAGTQKVHVIPDRFVTIHLRISGIAMIPS